MSDLPFQIPPDFAPEGWFFLRESLRPILSGGHFPTREDWQSFFAASEPPLSLLRLEEQEPVSQRQRRYVKEITGYSRLGGYLSSIVERRVLPHRSDNWHDFFNACIWATFPQSKTMLHRCAFEQLQSRGDKGNRTRVEDRLTRFDEGGLVIVELDGATQAIAFGHGYLEDCLFGRGEGIRLQTVVLTGLQGMSLSETDRALAEVIRDKLTLP